MKNPVSITVGLCLLLVQSDGFVSRHIDTCGRHLRHDTEICTSPRYTRCSQRYVLPRNRDEGNINSDRSKSTASDLFHRIKTSAAASVLAVGIATATLTTTPLPSLAATDSGSIVSCLFSKCQLPLLKCIANPKCLANVVCINTCTGRDDEIGCQIKCGDLFENEVVGEFNKCVVSDMGCVPQQKDEGLYPEPDPSVLVPKFDTKLWNGRWYITAGQNPLFDIL